MESIYTKAFERGEPGGPGEIPPGKAGFLFQPAKGEKQSYTSCLCLCIDPLVRALYVQ
jgi:hypothetical protein